jgi:hypothetical protein
VAREQKSSIYDFGPCMERRHQRIFFQAALGIGLLQVPIMLYMMKIGSGYSYVFSWCLACNLFLFFWYKFADIGKIPYITKTAAVEIISVTVLCVSLPIYICCKVFFLLGTDSALFLTFADNNFDFVAYLDSFLYVSRTAVPQDWFKPKFILTYMMCLSASLTLLTYCIQLMLFSVRITQDIMVGFDNRKVPPYFTLLFYGGCLLAVMYKLIHPDFDHVGTLGKSFIKLSDRVFSALIAPMCSMFFLGFAGYFRYLYREKLRRETAGDADGAV